LVLCLGDAVAQQTSESDGWQGVSGKSAWEQRVLKRPQAAQPDADQMAAPRRVVQPVQPAAAQAPPSRRVAQGWSPARGSGPLLVAQAVPPDIEVVPPPEEQLPGNPGNPGNSGSPRNPGPAVEEIFTPAPLMDVNPGNAAPAGPGWDDGDDCAQCDPCSECDECDEGGHMLRRCRHDCFMALLRNVTFFAGVHGFKGPVDRGQNGNFGFHEGLNFGAPLGDPWDCGFQLGFQGVHSNFSGSQPINNDGNSRDQVFFTGAVFHRAVCGLLQGGVAFDYVHDNYYESADLKQLRSETSLVFGRVHEIGYWGSYSISRDRFILNGGRIELLQPNDVFAAFYRRHFTGGGQGRVWVGATGAGEGVLGAEATIPLGTSWALENNFIYLIPKHGLALGGQEQEAWSVSISLVWYPGRSSRCVFQNPFQPLFGVADNSVFLVRRGAANQPDAPN
jgi:hypothetical protein